MHIIKQLSEDEFVIKIDDYDLDRHDSVRIAHDYVQFSGRTYINIEGPDALKPYGKFKSVASNIMGIIQTYKSQSEDLLKWYYHF